MGELAALSEPPAAGEAEGYFGQALSLAEELEMRPLQARTHLGLGRVLRLSGDRDRAEDHLAKALGLLREMDMRFWLSRAAEELLHLGHLFVVARHNIQLYDYLKREYAGEPVTVILDRRHGERRERAEATASERRSAERRRQFRVDESIRTRGFAVVPEIIGGA
jgi:tetratricopeptide (TPR) repeat protein